jgi:hypothetical protein
MYPVRETLHFCYCCHRRIYPGDEKKWHGVCYRCAADALDDLKRCLHSMTQPELQLLDDLFDGVALSEFKGVQLK